MTTQPPIDVDPLAQARHFVAHACRAMFQLARNATPEETPRALDLYALQFNVFISLHDPQLVSQARGLSIGALGLHVKPELGPEDTFMLMVSMVEILAAGRAGA